MNTVKPPASCEWHGPAPFSDEARRFSDGITLHILGGMAGYWAAIRLSDGGSDGIPYPTRKDAISHQLHESFCCYILIPRDVLTPHEAEHLLRFYRQCRERGIPISDPEHEPIPDLGLGGPVWLR